MRINLFLPKTRTNLQIKIAVNPKDYRLLKNTGAIISNIDIMLKLIKNIKKWSCRLSSDNKLNKPTISNEMCFLRVFAQDKRLAAPIFTYMLIVSTVTSIEAKSVIESVYFDQNNALIIETLENSNLLFDQLNAQEGELNIKFENTRISSSIKSRLQASGYQFEFSRDRSDNLRFWEKSDIVYLSISKPGSNLAISPETLLEGQAYRLQVNEQRDWNIDQTPKTTHKEIVVKTIPKPQLKSDPMKLSVLKRDYIDFIISTEESETEKFTNQLKSETFAKVVLSNEYKSKALKAADTATLYTLANELEQLGYLEQASSAYRRVLELNPNDLNAKYALAQVSNDPKEKLKNYLGTIQTQALTAIAQSWFEDGMEKQNAKTIAAAFVSYQFSILKDPFNPKLRYEYAQALEQAGYKYFAKAAQRYLEAASLAKRDFAKGTVSIESLLRNSTESLIRLTVSLGDFASAIKYCDSYQGLGFKKFLNGDSIKGIRKQVERRNNPFKLSSAMSEVQLHA